MTTDRDDLRRADLRSYLFVRYLPIHLSGDPMSNPMPYPPTWTDDDQDGPQWIVYESGEGFQPSYALVRAANALDAEEIGAELSNGWISAESDSVVVVEVR